MSDAILTFLCLVCGYFALQMLGVEAGEVLAQVADVIARTHELFQFHIPS